MPGRRLAITADDCASSGGDQGEKLQLNGQRCGGDPAHRSKWQGGKRRFADAYSHNGNQRMLAFESADREFLPEFIESEPIGPGSGACSSCRTARNPARNGKEEIRQ